jgi:nitronate monooxygenase
MPFHTTLTQRLGLDHPIIQAPLAGGGDTPDLVTAVCEAGALGFIGASYLTPPHIREAARAVRARTTRPFGINLFAPLPGIRAPRWHVWRPSTRNWACRHRRSRPQGVYVR